MQFTYEAISQDNSVIKGNLQSKSREEALQELNGRGYRVLELQQGLALNTNINLLEKGPNKMDMAMLCTQWALMDGAGISQRKLLEKLQKTTSNPQLKEALDNLRKEVELGTEVTKAMHKYPNIFSEAFIAQLETAIRTNTVEKTMKGLSVMYERNLRVEQEVRSALVQPGITVVIAIAIVILLMIMVIPQFTDIFSSMKIELPIYTRILIKATELLMSPWALVLLALIAAAPLYLTHWQKAPENRAKLDDFILRLPVVGNIMLLSALSRISRTLATMLENGMSNTQAIELSARAAGNAVLADIMLEGKRHIEHGGKLFEVLERYPSEFPATITGMVETGEESAQLAPMIDRIADFYESQVESEARNLAQRINPILTVGLALVVGVIMMAVMAPMSAMIGELSK
ncbi:type II secretion system F family protein [Deinococcus proteolyticus]|nr:type II secretion system F family protein [Deinococcus proteolyticus]